MDFKPLLVVFALIVAASACSSKSEPIITKVVTVHVYDCQVAESQELGDYILKQTKTKRFLENERDTCHEDYAKFLQKNPNDRLDFVHTSAEKVAGMWTYGYYTRREKVFNTPEEVLKAVEDGTTKNILLDKNSMVFVLELDDHVGNKTIEKIVFGSDMVGDIRDVKTINGMPVLRCNNFLHYLSKRVTQPFSITLTDSNRSNPEFRFKLLSKTGLGGFYTQKSLE